MVMSPFAAAVPVAAADDASAVLVQDSESLLGTLRRLHALNEAVMFYTLEGTLKLMLRNDPVTADTLACDLCIVVDEEDDLLNRMLELHADGYLEDPTTYVLESWSFDADKVAPPDLDKVAAAINAAYLLKTCPCRRYLIKDDGLYCYFCQLSSTAANRQHHFCPICCEDGVRMHMMVTACCSQPLHRGCLATWHAKSGADACPLCRRK